MIVFPANVLVCGELVTVRVDLSPEDQASSATADYDNLGLMIESLSYKSCSRSASSAGSSASSLRAAASVGNAAAASSSSMRRLRSVEGLLSSVSLLTDQVSAVTAPSPQQSVVQSTAAVPSPATSFSSLLAATMIDSVQDEHCYNQHCLSHQKHLSSTATATATAAITNSPTTDNTSSLSDSRPLSLFLSFTVDHDAVSDSPITANDGSSSSGSGGAILTLHLALTGKRGPRVERLRSFQATVPVIRALTISFLRHGDLVQLVLHSGSRPVQIGNVAMKGAALVSCAEQSDRTCFVLPQKSSHGLVFRLCGSSSGSDVLEVGVDAVIDGRPVNLSFESLPADEEPQSLQTQMQMGGGLPSAAAAPCLWDHVFKFTKLPSSADAGANTFTLRFQLQLPPQDTHTQSTIITQYLHSDGSSVVPVAAGRRSLPVLTCGIVQWDECFHVLRQTDDIQVFLVVTNEATNSIILQRTIHL